ncbi:polysaccharide biosynthesis protein [Actinomycetospora rhizophila]|uniref:Polysaccharide biosynthesis protein n=1 Tax=Actinomycetospora rhizophila TaxID=1416876 RepID=A0ABV9ZNA8_9PSEU
MGLALQVYRGRHCVGTLDDALTVATVASLVGLVVFGTNMVPASPWVPRSVPVVATFVMVALAVGARTAVRLRRERDGRPDKSSARRVIVFGAGTEGQQLIRTMLSDPGSNYLPVALLDDDPDVRLRRVLGVAVRGTRADVARVAEAAHADLLVIAHHSLDATAVRDLALAATEAGLSVQVLPPLTERLRSWSRLSDLQDLDINALLGRRPVEIDVAAIAGYLGGRRVLVTGAGGSIGSELCRQIHTFGPSELLMLDRDESALHATQLSIYGTALLDTPDVILADIRDAATLCRLFVELRPDVVFHAAALKHLPLLEQYPGEAWETNVCGTDHVLRAAQLASVDRFVNISTDKAADPISVLGRSKRIGERLVAQMATESEGTYLSVRFGNVLGSRGSVLTTFADQIANGTPVTVTHPDVTRFFMTIPEAVQLVIYAAAIGAPGEALVLDMGAPVRIADVARQLMGLAGKPTEIVYTGLRDGEKLHEELLGRLEVARRPIHPAISHIDVPTLDPDVARARASAVGAARALSELTTPRPAPDRLLVEEPVPAPATATPVGETIERSAS